MSFEDDFQKMMKDKRAIDLKNLKVTPQDPCLNYGGGEWLGWVRDYIKCKCVNGEDVTWGSEDHLKFRNQMTVREFEHIAATIASKAVNQFIEKLNMDGVK